MRLYSVLCDWGAGMKVILASASPRRREILSEITASFDIIPADCEECADPSLSPRDVVLSLARQKAENVRSRYPSAAVLGADTIVVFAGRILGKPKDAEDARRTLRMLSGKTHSVLTGYCILCGEERAEGVCETEVDFHDLSDAFIEEYVAGGSPMDKAGSYGIQDDARLVRAYRGSYTNIVGLPAAQVGAAMKKLGIVQ